MAILINKDSKVIVLGITGKSGALQTKAMLDAGTDIVAGVTPGKGGQEVYGVPVYNFVSEAAANTSLTQPSASFRPSRQRTPAMRP